MGRTLKPEDVHIYRRWTSVCVLAERTPTKKRQLNIFCCFVFMLHSGTVPLYFDDNIIIITTILFAHGRDVRGVYM